MIHDRPPRLKGFNYVGLYRYHVVIGTFHRRPLFQDPAAVASIRARILPQGARFDIAIRAYCFMPDHLHLLLEGTGRHARILEFMKRAKQSTGFWFQREFGGRLWQPGYYDRVLREEEDSRTVARYILENPVRAGLVDDPAAYPFSWCEWTGDLGLGERRVGNP